MRGITGITRPGDEVIHIRAGIDPLIAIEASVALDRAENFGKLNESGSGRAEHERLKIIDLAEHRSVK